MRSIRPVIGVYLCFILVLSTSAQTPQQDPQAVSILTQCLNVAGGSAAVSGVRDFTATGTITYNWAGQQVTGPLTVYGKGLGEFRMDATVSGGTQSFIVNGSAGH